MHSYQSSRSKRRRPMAEINVVPYIDVMLVLLIIFMVCAPMLSQGVNVHLPQAHATNLPPKPEPPVIVSVDRQGNYFLNISAQPNTPITAADLVSQVSAVVQTSAQNQEHRDIYVKGDDAVDYGKVMQAMVLLQQAGAEQVGLITQPPPDQTQ